jgi:hypothetical protein
MNIRKSIILPLVFLFAGCAVKPLVGDRPSEIPPRLVVLNDPKIIASTKEEILTWDRTFAFGRIPLDLKPAGDAACMSARIDLEAVGYHPNALGRDGQPLKGGGYFCWPKLYGAEPGPIPPKLINKDGVLGWDKPAAFGAVPKDQELSGEAICKDIDSKLSPIGYHPQALDESEKTIPGGGFFCAEIQSN